MNDKKATFLLEQNLSIYQYRVPEAGIIRIYEQLGRAPDIARTLIKNDVNVSDLSYSKGSFEEYVVELIDER